MFEFLGVPSPITAPLAPSTSPSNIHLPPEPLTSTTTSSEDSSSLPPSEEDSPSCPPVIKVYVRRCQCSNVDPPPDKSNDEIPSRLVASSGQSDDPVPCHKYLQRTSTT